MTKKIAIIGAGSPEKAIAKQCALHVVMPRCLTCKYWKQTSFYDYEGVVNDGECSELIAELDIQLKTGWEGGYVNIIETKQTFGCALHNEA